VSFIVLLPLLRKDSLLISNPGRECGPIHHAAAAILRFLIHYESGVLSVIRHSLFLICVWLGESASVRWNDLLQIFLIYVVLTYHLHIAISMTMM
jgi:hypothetical protein